MFRVFAEATRRVYSNDFHALMRVRIIYDFLLSSVDHYDLGLRFCFWVSFSQGAHVLLAAQDKDSRNTIALQSALHDGLVSQRSDQSTD